MRKLLILLGALAAAITVAHPSYKNVNNPDDDNEFSKERLDWVEKAGAENMKFHQQNMELISKQCDTTLTIILAGLGGAFAYIVKALDGGASDFVLYGVIAVAVLLTISGTILLIKCMMIDEFPAPTNEPNNLMIKGLDFDGIRKAELENLNIRIKMAIKRNEATGRWLNRARLVAVASPIAFLSPWAVVALGDFLKVVGVVH